MKIIADPVPLFRDFLEKNHHGFALSPRQFVLSVNIHVGSGYFTDYYNGKQEAAYGDLK